MAIQVLLDTPFASLVLDTDTRIAHLKRTNERLDWVRPPEGAYQSLDAALAALDRSRVGLLVDVRDAPPPRDDDQERAAADLRRALVDFKAVALLVKTVAGQLQVQRLAREDGRQIAVFFEEAAARAYLLEGLAKP